MVISKVRWSKIGYFEVQNGVPPGPNEVPRDAIGLVSLWMGAYGESRWVQNGVQNGSPYLRYGPNRVSTRNGVRNGSENGQKQPI